MTSRPYPDDYTAARRYSLLCGSVPGHSTRRSANPSLVRVELSLLNKSRPQLTEGIAHAARALPLVERKRRLARIMPRVESRLLLLDAISARGERLFELACERDLEGIVAKWSKGTYQCDGRGTSWVKIENPEYSQMEGRHELFHRTRRLGDRSRPKGLAPTLSLR